jgi:hypothetical protein
VLLAGSPKVNEELNFTQAVEEEIRVNDFHTHPRQWHHQIGLWSWDWGTTPETPPVVRIFGFLAQYLKIE